MLFLMKILFATAGLILWTLFPVMAGNGPLGDQEETYIQQARLLARRGDYEIALKAFNKIYDLNPKNTLARVEAKRLQLLKEKNPDSFYLTEKLKKINLPEFKINEAQYSAALKYLKETLATVQTGKENPVEINMIITEISPEPPLITYSLENVSWWDAFCLVLQAGLLDCELSDKTFTIKKSE